MAHVGNIHGTATMDPTGYTVGLRQMAQETYRFQQSIQSGSYGIASMGGSATRTAAHMNSLNRSVYASMTAFYMLTRQIGGAMNAYEEYDNIVARIGSTADMSTSSILGLSEALKGLNRQMAGNRTDLMKGMYRAVQSGFTSPSEFVPIAESAMRLRTASGREINTTKAADLISGIRNSLGVKAGREEFITDMLLRGRDVGRYELNQMASALGIPLTIYGNQYSQKIGAEETLRQVVTLLSATTKANLDPNRAATGIRRILEKSLQLAGKPDSIGKSLTRGMQGLGYKDVYGALDEGMLPYLRNLLKLTEGGSPEGLVKMGFGSREMMVTAAALSRGMSLTDPIYAKLASSEIAGTTDKYTQQQQESWWYQRDRLRSAYLDTQLSIMEAMLPTMKSFATSLEIINDLFQSLSPAIRNLIGLIAFGSAGQLMKNFFFRPQNGVGGKSGGFAIPPAGAMGGYYAGRSPNLGLTYNEKVQRVMNPSPVGNRSTGLNYRYRGPSGFVKPIEYASFDPSAYVPQTPHVSAFRRNVGNAWRFTWGGQAVREGMIGDYYNSRIEGREQAFNESRRTLAKQASGVYNNAVAGGMPHERAAAVAGNAFADSLSKMTTAMNAANKSTRFWTGAMSTLSGVMGTVGSIANMAAIGMLFQHILAFIEGLNHSKAGVKTGGVVDLRNAGKTHEQKNMFVRAWEESLHGSKIFASLFSDDGRGNAADLNIKAMEGRGYVLRNDSFEDSGILGLSKGQLRKIKGIGGALFRKPSVSEAMNPLLYFKNSFVRLKNLNTDFRKMNNDDLLQKLLMEELTQTERASFYQGTYKKTPEEIRAEIEKYAESGEMGFKAKGIFADDFLQRTNVHGIMSGQDVRKMATEGYIKAIIENTEAQNQNTEAVKSVNTIDPNAYTGVNLSFMEKLRGAAAPNLAAVEKFWDDAKKKGAYSTEKDYQNDLKKQFMQGGFLPDAYFQGFDGNLKLTKKIVLYDFLDYFENTEKLGPFTGLGGGLSMDPKNKKGSTFDTLKGAAALAEALPTLGSASHADIKSLIGKIIGENSSYNQYFEQTATAKLRRLNPEDYINLVGTGEHYTKPVQKYSDAVAFGTDAGYNATLPYWAEKGDEKQEIKIMFDKLMEFVADLKILSMKTEENTAVTASVVASQSDTEF